MSCYSKNLSIERFCNILVGLKMLTPYVKHAIFLLLFSIIIRALLFCYVVLTDVSVNIAHTSAALMYTKWCK